jgi:hypothetical protein
VEERCHRDLAELSLAVGDRDGAIRHASAAYNWAWSDGEPYVHRYELNKATALFHQLGIEIPKLPLYDPSTDKRLLWEDKVAAAIEKLRTAPPRTDRKRINPRSGEPSKDEL